jgi:hypothetical protein
MLLVLSISGLVAAATFAGKPTALITDPTVTTAQPFVDLNGDGIADSCQTGFAANPIAAAAAFTAADLNGDGQISIDEAAQSGWIGGANCNHGGYVSSVARATDQACGDAATAAATEASASAEPSDSAEPSSSDESSSSTSESSAGTDNASASPSPSPLTTTSATIACAPADAQQATDTTTPVVCVTPVAPVVSPAPTDGTLTVAPTVVTSPNDHGKTVSEVARSTAVGGKNCNHGGAVSEAAHKDNAARDAAKAARKAAQDARKLNKVHGKGHNG